MWKQSEKKGSVVSKLKKNVLENKHPHTPIQRPEMPFPILNLPRELRDHIYECALAPNDAIVDIRPGWINRLLGDKPRFNPIMNLFLVNRQIMTEAKPLFYNKVTFGFQMACVEDAQAIISFLKNPPVETLPKVRLQIYSSILLTSGITKWKTIALLLSQCGIRHIELRSTFKMEVDFYKAKRSLSYSFEEAEYYNLLNLRETTVTTCTLALLCELPTQLRNLESIKIEYEGDSVHSTGVASTSGYMRNVMFMARDSFLLDHQSPPVDGDLGVRLRYRALGDSYSVTSELAINRHGSTPIQSEWRSKVNPDRWCPRCGAFQDTRTDEEICIRNCDKSTPKSTHVTWDSNNWHGGPLRDYLPSDVNEVDFEDAKYALQSGYTLHEAGYYPYCGMELEEPIF
ncbi:hypothetical protein OPT61_g6312 [Boeremia exigua]|uniref:Uncharacterized protein n=1 Tax=Boeremia exigua TaxID=749465 RepID=A0ACC2I717_9PLEO|nr:hypothetical protein OPT61_g6312 [Boeremia exigua]